MRKLIKIHSFADVDRSGKVRWTARELGYEIEEVRVQPGEHLSPGYRELNPYAQIPTAELDGEIHYESSAVCLVLAQRHPRSGLVPEDAARFWQYLFLLSATLEAPAVNHLLAGRSVIDERWAALCRPLLELKLPPLIAELPEEGYLCGAFTLADIHAGYVLRLAVQGGLLPFEGRLREYIGRLRARPAAEASRVFDTLQG